VIAMTVLLEHRVDAAGLKRSDVFFRHRHHLIHVPPKLRVAEIENVNVGYAENVQRASGFLIAVSFSKRSARPFREDYGANVRALLHKLGKASATTELYIIRMGAEGED